MRIKMVEKMLEQAAREDLASGVLVVIDGIMLREALLTEGDNVSKHFSQVLRHHHSSPRLMKKPTTSVWMGTEWLEESSS